MKLIILSIIGVVLIVMSTAEVKGEPKPAFFTSLFETMGLRQKRYHHGTYIPLNGQEMPKKPRTYAEPKVMHGTIGSMVRKDCPEGYGKSRRGICQRIFAYDEWK